MDKNSNGQTWVGNMYQRFEAVCQEVDEFVNKDTVKYVENHMQTVGKSVKNFYSGVVQDILPPFVDPVKAIPSKQIDLVGTYTRSIIGLKGNTVDINTNKPSVEVDLLVPTEKYDTPSIIGTPHNGQVCPTSGYSVKEADSDLSLQETLCNAARVHLYPDTHNQEMFREEIFSCKDASSPAKVSHESSENHLGNKSFEEEGTHCNIISESDSSLFENADWGIENIVDLNSGTDKQVKDDDFECDSNTSSTLGSSELENSIVYCENKENGTYPVSSDSSRPARLCDLSSSPFTNSLLERNTICYNSTDSMGCFSVSSHGLSSSESFPALDCDKSGATTTFGFSSYVDDATIVDDPVSVAGSSGSKHDECCKHTQPEASISCPDFEDNSTVDVEDLNMETIDLSDKKQLAESCVFVEGEQPFAFSCRSGRSRSYKKIIQDAFTSRKRLTKEYKHLAIWYGDIDKELSQLPEENSPSKICSTPTELKKPQVQDLHDSEWELL